MHSLNGFGQWAAKNNLSQRTDMLMELPWPVWSGWGCELPGVRMSNPPITCKVNSKCKWTPSFPETLCMAGNEQYCPKTPFMENLGKECIAVHWHPSVLGSKLSSPNQKKTQSCPHRSAWPSTFSVRFVQRSSLPTSHQPLTQAALSTVLCRKHACSCFRPLIRLYLSRSLFSSFTPSSKVSFLTCGESF